MMSAWIAASSAPGMRYSTLAGIIMPAIVRKSWRCASVSCSFDCMAASIKEVGEALLHLIGDVERDGLDGGGRIDAARGDEQAAVDDEEVLHVMRTAPFIDHGAFGIGAHPRSAEQMPAAIEDRRVDVDVGGAGSFENLLRPRDAMRHHLRGVLADRVVDARRRNAVTVLQHRIERDAIVLLRQVLADCRDRETMAVELAEHRVMLGAPGQDALGLAGDGLEHRAYAATELEGIA